MNRVRLSRRFALMIGGGIALVLGAAALVGIDWIWTDYLWYASMGQQSVFQVSYASMLGVWLGCTAIAFLAIHAGARSAWKSALGSFKFPVGTAIGSLLAAGLMSLSMSKQWMAFRLAIAQSPFGLHDPHFGYDVGFFVFTLPAFELLTRWLTGLVVLVMVTMVAIAFIATRLDPTGVVTPDWRRLKRSFSILAGALSLLASANVILSIWQLSFSTAETPFAGASYADVHAQIPASIAIALMGVVAAVVFFATASGKRFKPVVLTLAVWAVAAAVLGVAWPWVVETYVAAPNEATLEKPYIERNIAMTRAAWDLTSVRGVDYPVHESLEPSAASAAQRSLATATIWSPTTVQQAFTQLQTIRPYYRLSDIDYDRYEYGGELHQVLVAARLIDPSGLPTTARTWVNQHLVYTHGYGLAISSASMTTPRGFPEFIVGEIPPRVESADASMAASLVTKEPRIYFAPGQSDYAIVDTGIDEFDYPAGQSNAKNRYTADSGVAVGNPMRRLAWAVRLGSPEVLFSRYLTPTSRVLANRDVVLRAKKLAPWLSYEDAYPALVDGRITWIIDGYTASDHYPYSQPLKNGTSYLRDSVKVTVDALTGDVTFYATGEDPIRDAWARIYPTIITPESEIPVAVAKHIRFPRQQFNAQASIYRTYHMTDPMVFYNKEDLWATPLDASGKPVKPTYVMADLPGGNGKGLYLLQPYSLPDKANLVGWMATSCEPGNYGEHTVYLLPKERVILGAAQIMARINQDPRFSQQLTLWTQPGSTVVFGDMLVLPVQNSVAYVQPVFLQAQNNAMAELVSVIVVNGDRVEFDTTLPGALEKAYGLASTAPSGSVEASVSAN
ncbi:MAG: UPF0182 family protein [Coriobacteriia bacterium]|nr:UPF0182 family protein [Coriobacteriia bacterium]